MSPLKQVVIFYTIDQGERLGLTFEELALTI